MDYWHAFVMVWIAWCVFWFLAMVLARPPKHPCYNGFRIYIPKDITNILTIEEFCALYAHEAGHRHYRHVWKNFVRVCLFMPVLPLRQRLRQEVQADDYAAADGHALALARALRKLGNHPVDMARATRLEQMDRERTLTGG